MKYENNEKEAGNGPLKNLFMHSTSENNRVSGH